MDVLKVKSNGEWVGIPAIVGEQGPAGPVGATGAGVPSGGTEGQILTKNSGTDYDTVWADDTAVDRGDIAYVQDGVISARDYAEGDYVYFMGHPQITDGLYVTNASIVSGAVIESRFVDAVSNGGLNALNNEVSTLNSKISALDTGSNFIGEMICAGYNSGSGSYAELFIPINTNGKTITAVTATSNSAIYLPSERVLFSNPPTITVVGTHKNGVRIEIQYATAKTANICISALLIGVTLTCS